MASVLKKNNVIVSIIPVIMTCANWRKNLIPVFAEGVIVSHLILFWQFIFNKLGDKSQKNETDKANFI